MKNYYVVARVWSFCEDMDERSFSEMLGMEVENCDYITVEWDDMLNSWLYQYELLIKNGADIELTDFLTDDYCRDAKIIKWLDNKVLLARYLREIF